MVRNTEIAGSTPSWVKDAVFYQIFPERFENGDPTNDPATVSPWGSQPSLKSFMGGDLQGIINRIDYLQELGVTAVYLNPIFWASSNHKYNPYSYYHVDPRFGDNELFQQLVAVLHSRGIRLILDGVFNHCGRGFFPFYDVMENRGDSSYLDWFYIKELPVDAYGNHKYDTWGDSRSNPKFKITNPATRNYLLDVAEFWTKMGIDGWRLDAADHIEDHTFWQEFRTRIRQRNPEAYILGEIWSDATPWIESGEFDGSTNYPLRGAVLDFFVHRKDRASHFAWRLERLLGQYRSEANFAMYNMLGSHDTPRVLTKAEGDVDRLKPAVVFQFSFPGAPGIYYGDEIGLEGGDDPDNRRCMVWDRSRWNMQLWNLYCKSIAVRKELTALRRGQFKVLFTDDAVGLCAFVRTAGKELAVVVVHAGTGPVKVELSLDQFGLPGDTCYQNRLTGLVHRPEKGRLVLPNMGPWHAAVLTPGPAD
jgi:cyclomaltodextrinase / maltogenic alpha-amylase / neopullulanase